MKPIPERGFPNQWTRADSGLGAERGEALKLAVLLLLEKLAPAERAAYVLREAFDYPYHQISEILKLEEANVRQIVSRARKHIADRKRHRSDHVVPEAKQACCRLKVRPKIYLR